MNSFVLYSHRILGFLISCPISSMTSSIHSEISQLLNSGSLDILPQFDRIGRGELFFKWTPSIHSAFLTWWLETPWIVERASTTDDWSKRLGWESRSRTSSVWQHFYQAANRLTGEPALVCQRCSYALSHPNVKASGTSTLSRHLESKVCQAGTINGRHSGRQRTLGEVLQVQVSRVSRTISMKTNR